MRKCRNDNLTITSLADIYKFVRTSAVGQNGLSNSWATTWSSLMEKAKMFRQTFRDGTVYISSRTRTIRLTSGDSLTHSLSAVSLRVRH